MQGNLWTVAVLACALALVVPFVGTGLDDATVPREATEEAEVDYSNPYELGQQDVEGYRNLTITNSSGVVLANGTDYDFNKTAGEVDFKMTQNTTSGELVSVEYIYLTHTQAQETGESVLESMAPWLGLSLLIAAMGYLIILLSGGSF